MFLAVVTEVLIPFYKGHVFQLIERIIETELKVLIPFYKGHVFQPS